MHDDFPRMVDLYMAGLLRLRRYTIGSAGARILDELITHRYGIDEANEDFRALAGGVNARGLIVF